jgi:hypothetical protein
MWGSLGKSVENRCFYNLGLVQIENGLSWPLYAFASEKGAILCEKFMVS